MYWLNIQCLLNTHISNITVNYCNLIIYINYYFSTTYNGHFPLRHGGKYVYFCTTWRKNNISNHLKYFLRQINYSVVCFQGYDSLKQIIILLKAILQVLIYKALYDKSYLGSKTTMTSGEWTCLISFATAPLTCSERGGSEKFKMKIYVSSGIRTHTPPVHDRKVAAP